jgi:hypothetical protein
MLTAAGSGPSWTHSWQRVPGIAEQCRHEPKECLVLQALHGNTVWESLPISSTLMTKLTNARMIIILFLARIRLHVLHQLHYTAIENHDELFFPPYALTSKYTYVVLVDM